MGLFFFPCYYKAVNLHKSWHVDLLWVSFEHSHLNNRTNHNFKILNDLFHKIENNVHKHWWNIWRYLRTQMYCSNKDVYWIHEICLCVLWSRVVENSIIHKLFICQSLAVFPQICLSILCSMCRSIITLLNYQDFGKRYRVVLITCNVAAWGFMCGL